MTDTSYLPQPVTPPARGLAGRVVGVLTSPLATYAEVAAHPRWPIVLLVVMAATAVPIGLLLSTDVGRHAFIDQAVQTLESFGRTVSDAEYRRIEGMAPYAAVGGAGLAIVGLPLAALAIAGIAFTLLKTGVDVKARFTQVLGVVVHSTVIMGLRTLLSAPLDYARQTLSSPTTLSSVLPFFGDDTFAARFFGSVDLFLIWWIVNLAIGLGVLYRRRTSPMAVAMLVVYGGAAFVVTAIRLLVAGA